MSIKVGGVADIILCVRLADTEADSPQDVLWGPSHGDATLKVRHSRRARRVAVRILADASVELVIPRGVSESRAKAFLAERATWVHERVLHRRRLMPPPEPFPPAQIPLSATAERWRVFCAAGTGLCTLRVTGEPGHGGLLSLEGDLTGPAVKRVLRRWLLRHARQCFAPQLCALAEQYGFHFRRLSVRSQTSRWGSCSAKGTISLNVAMLFLRPELVRYLMIHELTHTRHMNHSDRFWSLVERCEPDFAKLDAELNQAWRQVPAWLTQKDKA